MWYLLCFFAGAGIGMLTIALMTAGVQADPRSTNLRLEAYLHKAGVELARLKRELAKGKEA